MRKVFLHTVLSGFVALFLFFGSGANVAHYCCEACAEQGWRMFTLEGSCYDVHHHTHEHACGEHHHHHHGRLTHSGHHADGTVCSENENACSLQRIDIDHTTLTQTDWLPLPTQLIAAETQIDFVPQFSTHHICRACQSNAPPDSGRNLLSHICVLTI